MPAEHVPVLIVGGSLVGLTTAMPLGHHGVPPLAVERQGRQGGGAALVRPDGVVAWRSRGPATHDDIERALAR
jgi:2-polyprenyl-6-methoxyphenol hydroxylase-like FAD-dependent oxidoreductase